MKEYENDALYKALINSGFSDEKIEGMVAAGTIKLEKSKSEKDMDRSEDWEKKNAEDDKKHIDDLKKDEKEDKKDEKDLKRDKKEKEDKKDNEKMEKSFSIEDVMKLQASMFSGVREAIAEGFGSIQKSMVSQAPTFTPSFKGADFNGMVLEKSLPAKNDDGKVEISISRDYDKARVLVQKAIETADDDILKSIGADANAFMIGSYEPTMGESLARYMYDKHNIQFGK